MMKLREITFKCFSSIVVGEITFIKCIFLIVVF